MMVKYYKPVLGMDGKPVHELIVNEALKLLPDKIQRFLGETIDQKDIRPITTIDYKGNWRVLKKLERKTLAELIIEGSRAEDQAYISRKHYVNDKPISRILGMSVPSLAHYWNYEKYKNKHEDVGLIAEEKVKTPYWWLPGVNVVMKKVLQSLSKNNIPFQSALSRALIYWNDGIKNRRKKHNKPKIKAQIYLLLGRIIHLLTDVGVPAHSHCDTHFPLFDPDSLELNVGFWMNDSNQKWSAELDQKIIFDRNWSGPREFFCKFAEISILFDSDDVDGYGEGKPYRWGKNYRLGTSGYINKYACESISNVIIPLNFRFIAGIILQFFKEYFPNFWRENESEFLKNTSPLIEF
ncbi:MAG: hypothetical protein GF329_02720 [Candidatus Lokiarchaeota archaeon]|nr:hypothetical protein [Candidatus Lokiarchaeota archaeon]